LNGRGLGVLTIRERTGKFGLKPESSKWHEVRNPLPHLSQWSALRVQ
jgi:hypothetical protein